MKKQKGGRKKYRETRHPVYLGVRERGGGGRASGGGGGKCKWVCEVREPNKKSRIWLGTFLTPEMAARAHDVAALALRGDGAALNFPDSAWNLPRASTASHHHIRCAAMEAAEMHHHPLLPPPSAAASERAGDEEEEDDDVGEGDKELYLDEEVLFNQPGFIDSMSEAMLLTPPAMKRGFDWDRYDDRRENAELSLWSHE